MAKHVKVTRNGQVTIPKQLREEMQLEEGDYVELTKIDDGIMMRLKKAVYVDPREVEENEAAWRDYLEGKDPGKTVEQISQEQIERRHD